MSVDLSKQYNYKLRHKVTGSFYSNSRKATWKRASAIMDILRGKWGYIDNPEDYEVVLIPLENAIEISTAEFMDYHIEAERQKDLIKTEKREQQLKEKEKREEQEEIAQLQMLKRKYPYA